MKAIARGGRGSFTAEAAKEITPLGALRRCQRGRMTEAYQTKPAGQR